jgi:DNA repair photolyase
MNTIESIVRELEKIPEPMQVSLLDFIRSLSSSYTTTNQPEMKSVESNAPSPSRKRRTTSTLIAGKGKTLGDIVSPIVDERDWECLK